MATAATTRSSRSGTAPRRPGSSSSSTTALTCGRSERSTSRSSSGARSDTATGSNAVPRTAAPRSCTARSRTTRVTSSGTSSSGSTSGKARPTSSRGRCERSPSPWSTSGTSPRSHGVTGRSAAASSARLRQHSRERSTRPSSRPKSGCGSRPWRPSTAGTSPSYGRITSASSSCFRSGQAKPALELIERPVQAPRIARVGRQDEDPLERRDDDAGGVVRLQDRRDRPLLLRPAKEAGKRRVPDLIGLADDRGDRAVSARAQRELAHDGEELGLVTRKAAQPAEVSPQLLAGRARGAQGRAEAAHRMADDPADERLLRGVVVVERRDVEPDRSRHVAGAQALEPPRRDEPVGGGDELLLPFHQSDD